MGLTAGVKGFRTGISGSGRRYTSFSVPGTGGRIQRQSDQWHRALQESSLGDGRFLTTLYPDSCGSLWRASRLQKGCRSKGEEELLALDGVQFYNPLRKLSKQTAGALSGATSEWWREQYSAIKWIWI